MNIIQLINSVQALPQHKTLNQMRKDVFIYYKYDAYIRSGVSKLDAIEFCSIDFNKCNKTIYNIINTYAGINNNL